MAVEAAQAPPDIHHLVLYDGVCGLCNRVLRFLLVHDRERLFKFAPLQSRIGRQLMERAGGDPQDLVSFYVVASYGTPAERLMGRSRAALFIANALGWPWRAATLLGVLLPTTALDRLYNVVARNRYRLFGRYDECLVPSAEFRSRLVE
jgi:predicted DCC family thiol-disulfide oxidoreductase YuxK